MKNLSPDYFLICIYFFISENTLKLIKKFSSKKLTNVIAIIFQTKFKSKKKLKIFKKTETKTVYESFEKRNVKKGLEN